MAEALSIVLIILAIVLTTLVLTQSKGADLGGFLGGGSGDSGGVTRTRRGVEAVMHNLTKAVAAVFFVTAFIALFVWGGRF